MKLSRERGKHDREKRDTRLFLARNGFSSLFTLWIELSRLNRHSRKSFCCQFDEKIHRARVVQFARWNELETFVPLKIAPMEKARKSDM